MSLEFTIKNINKLSIDTVRYIHIMQRACDINDIELIAKTYDEVNANVFMMKGCIENITRLRPDLEQYCQEYKDPIGKCDYPC